MDAADYSNDSGDTDEGPPENEYQSSSASSSDDDNDDSSIEHVNVKEHEELALALIRG